jgi:hypothetical protein
MVLYLRTSAHERAHQDIWSQYLQARAAVVCYQRGFGLIRFEGRAQLGAAIRAIPYIVVCTNRSLTDDAN